MSSSFWVASDDEWDDDIYSSESDGGEVDLKPTSRFADLDIGSDDEDDEKRVSKSAAEKAWDDLHKSIKVLRSVLLSQGWSRASAEWDTFKKVIAKSNSFFERDGIPRFVTNYLLELQDTVKEVFEDKNAKKSMIKTDATALNSMHADMKKWFVANPEHAERVAAFRENPALATVEDVKPGKAPAKAKADAETKEALNKPKLTGRAKWLKRADVSSSSSSDDDDDQAWLDDEDDEDDEADISALRKSVKKSHETGDEESAKTDKKKDAKAKKTGTDTDKAEEEEPKSNIPKELGNEKPETWTGEKIDAKMKELVARRGTRNYDRLKQMGLFAYLIERTKEKANTPDRLLRLYFALVDAQFDVNQNMYSHLNIKVWRYAFNTLVKIFEIIQANKDKISVVDTDTDVFTPALAARDSKISKKEAAKAAQEAQAAQQKAANAPVEVRGLLLVQLERLDEEYFKSLQYMDPHTQEYVARMRHEVSLLKLLRMAFDYFQSTGQTQKAASIAARRLEHVYYRRDSESAAQKAAIREAQRQLIRERQDAEAARDRKKNDDALRDSASDDPAASETASQASTVTEASYLLEVPDEEIAQLSNVPEDPNVVELVPELCGLVYKSDDERLRIRAVLQHIYHLALHDKYFEARDRMLATRMQDEITNAPDITMHIAYNRSLVQLGLAAFRKGRIADAHNALAELVGTRLKEFLAQGMSSRNLERTVEQEKMERRRQVPYPMHINTDLVEFVHLTSAMLLEVPNMAANAHDPRKRIISKSFRKTLENSERQTFTGPPENTREHVIAAAKALIQSDWQLATKYLLGLDIWKLFPKPDDVKPLLKRKIQEEALRTHLFTNAQFYETIKLEDLITMFDLPKNTVHSIVSRMMIHDELLASWDQPSASIVMSGQSPSHLQHLSLQYAERISALFDNSDSGDSRGGNFNRGQQGNWPADSDRNQQRRGGQNASGQENSGYRSQGGQGDKNQGQRNKEGGDRKDGGKSGPRDGGHKGPRGGKPSGGKKRN